MSPLDKTHDSENQKNNTQPAAWKPGSKVNNASRFGVAEDPDDLKYAPKDAQNPVADTEIAVEDILMQKRQERLSEDGRRNVLHDKERQEPADLPDDPVLKETHTPEFVEDDENLLPDRKETLPAVKKPKRPSSLPFYILLVILLGAIATTGYFIHDQKKDLPLDEYGLVKDEYNNKKLELKDVQNEYHELQRDKLIIARLSLAQERLLDAEEIIRRQDEQKAALHKQIHATQEEMVTYFRRYRSIAQKQARGLYLDQLITRSGRQFDDVTVNRCFADQISIMHSTGATTLLVADLPDAVQDRLAYSNPFSDVEATLKAANEALKATMAVQPASGPVPQSRKAAPLRPQSYEPPAGLPKVSSPGQSTVPGISPLQTGNIIPPISEDDDEILILPDLPDEL